MNGEGESESEKRGSGNDFVELVAAKEARKERSRREGRRGVAYGFGMFGLVGWSVVVPTLLGVALGAYIDSRGASRYSWTLMLMILGLALGAVNAWYWVKRESGGE